MEGYTQPGEVGMIGRLVNQVDPFITGPKAVEAFRTQEWPMLGVQLALFAVAIFFLAMTISGLVKLGSFKGQRGSFLGGNFSTAGNSPLWEGGALSDQANLSVSPMYADRSVQGQTAWLKPCPPAGGLPGAGSEASLGGSLQSIGNAPSCGSLSDAALAGLAR
jgi:hypothetical protein